MGDIYWSVGRPWLAAYFIFLFGVSIGAMVFMGFGDWLWSLVAGLGFATFWGS